jgi:hypothetical protein
MYLTTKARHAAIAHGISKLFKPIYEAEFGTQYPSEIEFYRRNLWFITLTFKQPNISLSDRLCLSTADCPYKNASDDRSGGFIRLQSKNISVLQHIARKLGLQDFEKLHKLDLIFAIQDKLGDKQPILQRSVLVVRPKPHPLKVFEYLHFKIAKHCLGSNLQRKLQYQPLALAYVDFEGTRRGASVDPLQSTWAHVHAVMFVRPQHVR